MRSGAAQRREAARSAGAGSPKTALSVVPTSTNGRIVAMAEHFSRRRMLERYWRITPDPDSPAMGPLTRSAKMLYAEVRSRNSRTM